MRPLALVTGGWRRIGAAIAKALAAGGWDLALHAHHRDGLDSGLARQLEQAGATVHGIAGDLVDANAPELVMRETVNAFGRAPSLLVNSASIFRDDQLATLTADSLDLHMRTNLYAPLLLTKAFAARLGDGEGSIVMLLDQRVRNPVPDQLAYSLSKQALHASIRNLARDLVPRIRVNGVAPGLVLPTGDYDAAQWERLTALMPLERLAAPADIAAAVIYLANACASARSSSSVSTSALGRKVIRSGMQ